MDAVTLSDDSVNIAHIAGYVAVKAKQYCEWWFDSNDSDKYIRPSETLSIYYWKRIPIHNVRFDIRAHSEI